MTDQRGYAGRLQLEKLVERARSSLFVAPAAFALCGAVLAVVTLAVDRAIAPASVPRVLRVSPESARTLLSTIAGATITTAGVVFSITVLAVQLSTAQFTPRATRRLFRDRAAQATVGLLVSAFIFTVVVLSRVRGGNGEPREGDVPVISTIVALTLAVAVIVGIIAFLNHIARSLYVGNLIAAVTGETRELMAEVATHSGDAGEQREEGQQPDDPPDGPGHVILARDDGWVQQISGDAALAALPPRTVARLQTRAGAFLVAGTPLFTLWPAPDDEQRVADALNDAVVVGNERTMQQDVDFGLRQLVDIAVRALSPSLNDPTTAVEVVLRIGSLLRRQLGLSLRERQATGDDGRVLLRPYETDYGRLVRHAFQQIRLAGRDHPVVLIAVVRTLHMLLAAADDAGRPGASRALERELALTVAEAERGDALPEDVAEVRRAAEHPTRLAIDPDAGPAVISDGL